LEYGFKVNLLSKSSLVLRDMDLFVGRKAGIGVSITTLDEQLSKLWEPQAASPEQRLRVVEAARKAGLKTTIMFAPVLPFLSDGRDSLEKLFQRVWPSVAGLLRKHYPELRERYSRILFNPKIRAEYLAQFHSDVALAAERLSLTDRVTECF
jgi:DNA repair photolyase